MTEPQHSDRPPVYPQVPGQHQVHLPPSNAPYFPSVPMGYATSLKFSSKPVTMNCPHCGLVITTIVEDENGLMVYLICIGMILVGIVCGCCLIPFCLPDLKDKVHSCPRCLRILGKKTAL